MTVHVETLSVAAFQSALEDLARLRITVFRDWPYLYDGSMAYEQTYMAKFAATPSSVIVAARDGDRIVGCATAVPLLGHDPAFAEPFLSAGYAPEKIFYFGESVLLREYRGRGIGHAFFDHREAAARRMPGITHAAFCAVVRPDDHPARPDSSASHAAFWTKRGYATDVGMSEKTAKPMQFWMRAL
jgi:GNAT superfamily N-acetyltransferase